jgi:esterase/lipase superfamily enzyme
MKIGGIIESMRYQIEMGWIQIYALDSIDQESFYCFWAHPHGRILRHIEFEAYVLNEVIPFTAQKNNHECLMSVGCSMGAFHAVNIAFRHPHLFSKVIGLSGRYDLSINVGVFNNLFDDYNSDYVYYHSPSKFVPNINCNKQLDDLRKLDITIVCGNEDPFVENNRLLSSSMWKHNIQHKYYEWDGLAHKSKYWRQMLPMYI